jgi:hypothetical protein
MEGLDWYGRGREDDYRGGIAGGGRYDWQMRPNGCFLCDDEEGALLWPKYGVELEVGNCDRPDREVSE